MIQRCPETLSDLVWAVRLKLSRAAETMTDTAVVGRMNAVDLPQRAWACTAVAAGVVIVSGAAVVTGLAAYPHLAGQARWTELETLDACTRSVEIHGAGGWAGRIPAFMFTPLADTSGDCRKAEDAGWRAHAVGHVADPPGDWWRLLTAAEDRRHGAWTSVNCVDLPALGAAVWHAVRGRRDRGGSTLAMQLSRSLRGLAPSRNERWRDRLRRKAMEIGDAAVLCHALGGADAPELRRWVARHLPCVHGTLSSELGGSVYGIDDCARIVFGKPASALDLAEHAVLVAAVRRHVLVAPAGDAAGQRRARERWGRIRARALRVLDAAFGPGDPAADPARSKIARMEMPFPAVAPALRPLLPDNPVQHVGVAANPERRAAYFARGEMIQALGEVLDVYGAIPRDLVGIELTLDVADNARFKRAVEDVLVDVARRRPLRLDLPPAGASANPIADVTLSLADGAGRVVRHYSAGHDRVWSGANAKRDTRGRYRPDREDRQVGSIAKMLAAPLLGARFRTTDAFCDRRLDGLRNPDGDRGFPSCRPRAAWVPAPAVFARSLNLPMAWALRRVPVPLIEAAVADSGLQLTPDVAPRVAVAFGGVAGGTRAQHRLAAALNRGARGGRAWAVQPTLIRSLFFLDESGGIRAVPFDDERDAGPIDLSEWFRPPAVAPFVTRVLAAPTRPGGTLAGLDRIVDAAAGSHLIAKTGTTTTFDGRIRDQMVVGSFVDRRGDQATFHLLIGAPDPNRPLADPGGAVSRRDRLRLIETLLAGAVP